MSTEYEASYVYSPSAARRVYLRMLWEWRAALVMASPLIVGWAVLNISSPEYGRLAWFALGVVLTWWWSWLRSVYAAREATPASIQVSFIARDDTCTFRAPDAEATIRWHGITRLYRFKRYWVFVGRDSFHTTFVPVAALTPETRSFVEDKIRAAGGQLM